GHEHKFGNSPVFGKFQSRRREIGAPLGHEMGIFRAFPHIHEGSEMKHAVKILARKLDQSEVKHGTMKECCSRIDLLELASGQVINNCHLISARQKRVHHVAADVARAASYEIAFGMIHCPWYLFSFS